MNKNKNLEFRRQFLFSAYPCKELINWKYEDLDSHHLYVHPDCEFTKVTKQNSELYLIGYAINPHIPEQTSLQVLENISNFKSISNVPELLYSLAGRFVLLIKQKSQFTIFHDACGLRQVYFTKYDNKLFAASQPLLLKKVINIKESKDYNTYKHSFYVKSSMEHWMPSGISLYKNVFHLVPNHYIDSVNLEQVRYWPNKRLKKKNLEESAKEISYLLQNTLHAANCRFKLALPLTAGKDSRLILSSCRDILNDLFIYTLKYRKLNIESNDIKIPQKLSTRFEFKHQIINCKKPIEKEFADIYIKNTDIPHLIDWGKIAHAMLSEYPKDRVALKGSCVEIGRCVYYKLGKHTKIKSSQRFLRLIQGWNEIDFFKARLTNWFNEVKSPNVNYGYDLFDLFYWEHRMGSWQAQSQLEWNIVHEEFTPFNNREIIDLMLSVNAKYRIAPSYLLFTRIIENLWNEVLTESINPTSTAEEIKYKIKNILIYSGVYYRTYQKVRSLLKL